MSIEDIHANAAIIKDLRAKYPSGTTSQLRAVSYVPVWFHIVSQTDGTGGVAEWKVLDMLCDFNKAYTDNGIALQFYIKGFDYISNDATYNYPRSLSGFSSLRNTKKQDGANVYITNGAGAAPNDGTLAYYSNKQYTSDPNYTNDWIVILKSSVSGGTNAFTIAHEMGHLFSLLHTFSGWEPAQFKATPQKPCAPVLASDNFTATEKHARTGSDANCADAGDLMCDTPEDYDFGYGYNGCTWTGSAQDPSCVAVTPSEKNIMGYFVGCLNSFSAQQKEAIINNYLYDRGRQYLRDLNITPSLVDLGTTSIVSPVNASTVNGYDNITLSWAAATGATGYYLQISTSASFASNEYHFLTTSASSNFNVNTGNTSVAFLQPNVNYYWRVRPMSSYKNCAAFTSGRFLTSVASGVNNIPDVSDFNVFPNPITNTKSLELTLSLEKSLDAVIKIVNVNGQIITQQKQHFDSGFTTHLLDLSNLQNGLYILRIESDRGVLNRKITMAN